MAKKLKGRANPLAELHFIANVSLEEAVVLIRDLADETYTVTLTEVDANNFKFEIDDIRTHSQQSKINGTFQRWQGTDTRIHATGDVSRHATTTTTLAGIVFMLLFVAAGLFLLATGDHKYGLVSVLPELVIIWLGISTFLNARNNSYKVVQFRERDQLLQLVIDTFKAATTIEAYEPTAQVDENIPFLSDLDDKQHKAKDV